jgi:hypothetical protein
MWSERRRTGGRTEDVMNSDSLGITDGVMACRVFADVKGGCMID